MKQQIVRIALVVAMMAASGIGANAQLNGLLNRATNAAKNAAKKKVTEMVEQEVKNQLDPMKNLPKADPKEGDVTLYYTSGTRLGIWHPKTRTLDRFVKTPDEKWTYETYIFNSNGSVDFSSGNHAGELKSDGSMSSTKTRGIKFNASTSEVTHNGDFVGKVGDDGSVYMFNEKMIYGDKAFDKDVECFVLFNTIASDDLINEYKEKYKKAVQQNQEQRERQLADLKAAQKNDAGGSKLWKGGSVVGELRANDEVWIGGSRRGSFENGKIRVGGSFQGELLSDGNVRKNGSIVGKIDGIGKVWLGGSIVGEVRANGDIVKGGSIIGKSQPAGDRRKIAVIYFFGFWAL